MTARILVVDDSKTIRMVVKKAFKNFDCELAEAENGVEGLAHAVKQRPDLIVLDITMPVMDGIEMLEKLKGDESTKEIPIIMLTAESSKENVMRIIKLGVKDYMVKPFKADALTDRVKSIIDLNPCGTPSNGDGAHCDYFSGDGETHILSLPAKMTRRETARIREDLHAQINAGMRRLILDISNTTDNTVALIELVATVIENSRKSNVHMRAVGTPDQGHYLKDFHETRQLTVHFSLEQAKAAF
jgi:CheY-like chemotaxis protein